MSRSGYSDECSGWELICWRGAVKSAIRGARGQGLLRELAAAMDAMPVKELVAQEFEAEGQFCALGVVGAARGVQTAHLVDADRADVAKTFGIAEALAAEIMDVNDNAGLYWPPGTIDAGRLTREKRWREVREWVRQHTTETA